MFWEQFWSNYLSSVLAGITLGALGGGGYFLYYKKMTKKKQNIKQGGVGIQADNIENLNVEIKDTKSSSVAQNKEDIKKITEEYAKRQN